MNSNNRRERAIELIERGKQLGRSFDVDRDGRQIYVRVAIEKRDNRYKVIVDEVDHANMASEEFEREEQRWFDSLEEAVVFIEGTTPTELGEMTPSRGLKWF